MQPMRLCARLLSAAAAASFSIGVFAEDIELAYNGDIVKAAYLGTH